jgi:hypothetical protein
LSGVDRFGVPAAILRRFASGAASPARPADWLEPLERAGLPPAALLLCCQGGNLAWVEPLRQALAGLRPGFELVPSINLDTIVAWSPLTYAPEIESWTLRATAERLPDNLLSIRGLAVRGPALRRLGRGWSIVGRLVLQDLPRLQALDGPLELFGDLELSGLPELARLGPELTIHGNLTVAGCPALAGLPPDLRVDGAIWMDAAPAMAGRVVSPWPGLQPSPVPVRLPAGVLELAAQ